MPLAVVVLFFHKLNPFAGDKTPQEKKSTWSLWAKVVVSIIPSGVVGVLFDDWMDDHLHTAPVVAAMLIVYGIAFILVERQYQGRHLAVDNVDRMDWKTAIGIGLFQCLSLIPGTSGPAPPSWAASCWGHPGPPLRSSASSWPFPPCWEPAALSC